MNRFTGSIIHAVALNRSFVMGHLKMIRPFAPSDMEQVLAIWLDASIQAHDFIPEEFWRSKLSDMREVYLPDSETYVFSENGTVMGFISLHGDTLAALFVSPEFQGQGIGRQLLDEAKTLRDNLSLTVYRQNRKAIRFYEQNGFTIVREQVDRHTGHTEILMTCVA